MQQTSWLAGTRWYVTAENLLAYLTDPSLRVRTPVADQTLWSITATDSGSFQGTSQTQLWVRAPAGGLQPMGSARNALEGTITEEGDITILFTPDEAGESRTVGYGRLRRVDGAWRMEMQMATGTQSIAIHWAYMTQWQGDEAPPPPADLAPADDLRSGEWRWLRGTAWSAVDRELFPDGAAFTLAGYRNGYCWGDGATADGSTLRMAGSVTPEGTLYLLFSIADAPAVARRGTIAAYGEAYRMTWSEPAGGPTTGGAAPEADRPDAPG
jgi:hypothetical protein